MSTTTGDAVLPVTSTPASARALAARTPTSRALAAPSDIDEAAPSEIIVRGVAREVTALDQHVLGAEIPGEVVDGALRIPDILRRSE